MIQKKENRGFFVFSIILVFLVFFVFLKNIEAKSINIDTPKKSNKQVTVLTISLNKKVSENKTDTPIKKHQPKIIKKVQSKVIKKPNNKSAKVNKQKIREEALTLANEKKRLKDLAKAQALEEKRKEEALALANEKKSLETIALKQKLQAQALIMENEKYIYLKELSLWVQSHLSYPRSAKKLHHEGEVKLTFMITKNGDIHSVKISSNCAYSSLNKAAKKLMQEYNHFKALPPSLNELKLELPITYAMNN